MSKQTINLLGGVVVAAILLLGLLLGVLPRWQAAQDADADRHEVALRNQEQQAFISALAAQREDLPQLRAQVGALKQQIASGPHLEQVIELASGLPGGAVLRSITPAEGDASGAGTGTTATPTPGAGTGGGTNTGAATGTVSTFAALPVTIVIDVRRATDAAAVLDKLREGPRLLAVDQAELTESGAGDAGAAYTLTVTGRVFTNQEATQ